MYRKQKFIKYFNKLINLFKIYSSQQTPIYKVKKLIDSLKAHNLGYTLIRIGSQEDGGYLVPSILNQIDFCFSPGVGNSVKFEEDLYKNKIKSYLADNTVERPKSDFQNFEFIKKNIGTFENQDCTTLDDWIDSSVDIKNKNLLLQMDIEGKEYECISALKEENLQRFKIIIIEFHYFDQVFNHFSYELINSTINKLLKHFEVAHIHPNNIDGMYGIRDVIVPAVLEITFLRKDLVLEKNKTILPHKLDKKNSEKNKDIKLSSDWY